MSVDKEVGPNLESEDITGIDSGERPQSLEALSGGDEYGTGLPLIVQPDRTSKQYAIGNNLQAGYGAESVAELQRYMAQELDENWDKDKYGNTEVLPLFGIDGAWGCETQAAFNKLLEKKGVDCKKGDSDCPGVPGCIFDDATLQRLKDAEAEQEEAEEVEQEEAEEEIPSPPIADQCYLIRNIDSLISNSVPFEESKLYESTNGTRESIKYEYLHKVDTKDPATMMNKLRMRQGALQFLNIRHWQLSQLVPTIKIYKQYPQGPGKEPREVEIKFNSFVDPVTDLQELLNSQLQRGIGVGIEYLSYDWVGPYISVADKMLTGKLAIYAQNFNELLKTRRGFDQHGVELEGGYRIIDMLLPDALRRDPNQSSLKAVVGWAATGGGGILEPELVSAIEDTQLSIDLGVVDYNIDILDQDGGAVRVVVDLYPRTQALTMNTAADIFADSTVRARRKKRKEVFRELTSKQKVVDPTSPDTGVGNCLEDEEIAKLKEIYDKAVQVDMDNSAKSLMEKLLANKSIYSLEIPPGEGDSVRIDPESINIRRQSPEGPEEGVREVPYFFLGDLLEATLQNVLDRDDINDVYFGKIRYISGPTTIPHPDPSKGKILKINIADIPISVELYTAFMSDKLKHSVEFGQTYPLHKFTSELVKEVVFEAMGPECESGTNRMDINLSLTTISADPAFGGIDPIEDKLAASNAPLRKKDKKAAKKAKSGDTAQVTVKSALDLDQFNIDFTDPSRSKIVFDSLYRASAGEQYHYIVLHSIEDKPDLSYDPETQGDTRYERDFKNGVYHLTTGLDRGLLIGTTFSLAQRDPLYRSARFLQDMGGSADVALANLFTAEIEMYGNNFFYPGMCLYLNPRGLGADLLGEPTDANTPSISNILGLGGYQRVSKVSHRIDTSGYKTTVSAIFTAEGNDPRAATKSIDMVGEEVIKCSNFEDAKKILEDALKAGGE